MGSLLSQLGAQIGQLEYQAGQSISQGLSKPRNQALFAKVLGELLNNIKK